MTRFDADGTGLELVAGRLAPLVDALAGMLSRLSCGPAALAHERS